MKKKNAIMVAETRPALIGHLLLQMQQTNRNLFDEALMLAESYKKDDITYDVNFKHVVEAFVAAGFKEEAYETQARALVRFGLIEILERFAKTTTQSFYAREADKIKTLLSPTMMGDRFKMIHFRK